MFSILNLLCTIESVNLLNDPIESIYEINEEYSSDSNYSYKSVVAMSSEISYYFSYLPTNILKIPFGSYYNKMLLVVLLMLLALLLMLMLILLV